METYLKAQHQSTDTVHLLSDAWLHESTQSWHGSPLCGVRVETHWYNVARFADGCPLCKTCARLAEQRSERAGDEMRTEARRLGADHALAMASWVEMTEVDARAVLEDVDPGVLDQWTWPNLSGAFADDPTPQSLMLELGVEIVYPSEDWCCTCTDEVCAAWQESAEQAFSEALQAVALRTLGRIAEALAIERELEKRAES